MSVFKRDPKTGRTCKRGQSGGWYYDFAYEGRRYREAIPLATTLKEAEKAETKAKNAVYEGTYNKRSGQSSFIDFANGAYMTWARQNKRSIILEECVMPIMTDFFKSKRFCDITPTLIEKYRDQRIAGITRRGTKRSPNSVARELAILSGIFTMAMKRDIYESNPVSKVDWMRKINRRERFISTEEEKLILERLSVSSKNLLPLFVLALYSGMRRGEMFNMKWTDIDFKKNFIFLREGTTKNGKARQVPLIEPARSILLNYQQSSGADLSSNVFPINRDYAGGKFREICQSLQLHDVGLHTLRHTYQTRMAQEGASPYASQDILGHSDLDMTFYYSHNQREDLAREAQKLGKYAERLNYGSSVLPTNSDL